MVSIRRKFVDTDFGRVYVRLSGSQTSAALPLVCLHMAPQSGQDYEAFMKLAGRDKLVIAPDYPGYGESDALLDDMNVSIETYAKAVWHVVDALNLSDVEILGYHTGSKVGIEMALQAPQRTSKLYCISLSTMTPGEYKTRKVAFEPLSNRKSESWFSSLKGYYDPALSEEVLKQKFNMSLKVGSRSHLGFKASHLYNAKILEKLGELQVPVALINPNDDLHAVTPKAAAYIENCVLIERGDWLPGFLDVKPHSVIETLNFASQNLNDIGQASLTPLAS